MSKGEGSGGGNMPGKKGIMLPPIFPAVVPGYDSSFHKTGTRALSLPKSLALRIATLSRVKLPDVGHSNAGVSPKASHEIYKLPMHEVKPAIDLLRLVIGDCEAQGVNLENITFMQKVYAYAIQPVIAYLSGKEKTTAFNVQEFIRGFTIAHISDGDAPVKDFPITIKRHGHKVAEAQITGSRVEFANPIGVAIRNAFKAAQDKKLPFDVSVDIDIKPTRKAGDEVVTVTITDKSGGMPKGMVDSINSGVPLKIENKQKEEKEPAKQNLSNWGFGLRGAKTHVESTGGWFHVSAAQGVGTTVTMVTQQNRARKHNLVFSETAHVHVNAMTASFSAIEKILSKLNPGKAGVEIAQINAELDKLSAQMNIVGNVPQAPEGNTKAAAKGDEKEAMPEPRKLVAASKRKKILVIEDAPISQKMIQRMLSTHYDVVIAKNSDEAISIMKTDIARGADREIGAIIFDNNLDGSEYNGPDTIKKLMKIDCDVECIPVFGNKIDHKESAQLAAIKNSVGGKVRAELFMVKPYNKDILLKNLKTITTLAPQERKKDPTTGKEVESPVPSPVSLKSDSRGSSSEEKTIEQEPGSAPAALASLASPRASSDPLSARTLYNSHNDGAAKRPPIKINTPPKKRGGFTAIVDETAAPEGRGGPA